MCKKKTKKKKTKKNKKKTEGQIFYSSKDFVTLINPYKHGVPFVGHRQTVLTYISRRIMRRLINVFTVRLQEFQLQIEQKKNEKKKYT